MCVLGGADTHNTVVDCGNNEHEAARGVPLWRVRTYAARKLRAGLTSQVFTLCAAHTAWCRPMQERDGRLIDCTTAVHQGSTLLERIAIDNVDSKHPRERPNTR